MSSLAFDLFKEAVTRPEEHIDLATTAMLIALEEYPDLKIQAYLDKIDLLVYRTARSTNFPVQGQVLRAVKAINHVLFVLEGYSGDRENYYDPRNSYLNEVLDRRLGIPITLSVLYMEIGRRLGLKIDGVGMPGHFLTKFCHSGSELFIDAFNRGELLKEDDCRQMFTKIYGQESLFDPTFLHAVTKTQILSRMLANLKAIYFNQQEFKRSLSIINKILFICPNSAMDTRDRGIVHYRLNQLSLAVKDWSRYLDLAPSAEDRQEIKKNISTLSQVIALRN